MAKIKKHWEKTTPYGDYNETSNRISANLNNVTHIIREAKALGLYGKHIGSKPLYKILRNIAKAHKAQK